MTRDEILQRYRHLRLISIGHHSGAMAFVSKQAVLEHAKRLGLATAGMLVAESEAEMTLVFDLALYTAKEHRSRALDRYARATPLPPSSDAARMLEAMRHARFSVWRIKQRHETAGLIHRRAARGRGMAGGRAAGNERIGGPVLCRAHLPTRRLRDELWRRGAGPS